MKCFKLGVIIIFFALLLTYFNMNQVYAHPGNTDESGGHLNHSTGEYHYHHECSEHQHSNGVCRYELLDKIGDIIIITILVIVFILLPIYLFIADRVQKNREIKIEYVSQILDFDRVVISKKMKEKRFRQIAYTEKIDKVKELNEYEYYFNLYAFMDPSLFVTMPEGVQIVQGKPITNHKGTYGAYTVYIALNGQCYHQDKNCGSTYLMWERHILDVPKHMKACKKCVKDTIPDYQWFYEYERIANIKKKYNIP